MAPLVSNQLVGRLAMIFVAFSCSLPLLLMLNAPPMHASTSGDAELRFPGSDPSAKSNLRSIADRALMMIPHDAPAQPLPAPPPLEESKASDADALVVAGTGGGGGSKLALGITHNEHETEEDMLARMSDPPAMEDVIAYLDAFIRRLHVKFIELKAASKMEVYEAYRAAAERVLLPFDKRWRGRTVFPVRHGEGSIFLSVASYRDHRLENTLKEAFSNAKHPEKLFVGVSYCPHQHTTKAV